MSTSSFAQAISASAPDVWWRFSQGSIYAASGLSGSYTTSSMTYWVDANNTSSYSGAGTTISSLTGGYSITATGLVFNTGPKRFTLSNQYWDMGKTPAQLGMFSSSFSVSWVFRLSATSSDYFVLGTTTGSIGQGLHLGCRNGQVYCGFYSSDVAGGTVPLNTWTHVTFVHDKSASLGKIYINGVATASGSQVDLGAQGNLQMGRGPTAINFTGDIANFAIYGNKVLDDTEALANYRSYQDTYLTNSLDLNRYADYGKLGLTGTTNRNDGYLYLFSGTDSYSNYAYMPANSQSQALLFVGWNVVSYLTSSSTSSLWFLNVVGTASGFQNSSGLTVEWLYKYDYNWNYAPARAYMIGWYAPASPYYGWYFSDNTALEGGRYRVDLSWLSGSTNQTGYVAWSTVRPGTANYEMMPMLGAEGRIGANSSWNKNGSTGLHNGWHHFVLRIVPGPSFTLHVDGVYIPIDAVGGTWSPSVAAVVTSASNPALTIGNTAANASWGGYGEVAVYSRAISDYEIMDHWSKLTKWLSDNTGARVMGSASDGHVVYTTTQRIADNITAQAATTGSGIDARATKTNSGAN